MIIVNRETLIEREKNSLEHYAALSTSEFLTQRKNNSETNDENNIEIRLAYQRDRDRIIHSRAFRRLVYKTQVFNANKGDHYRNRLTHTLEVDQIARSIGKCLGLNDELIEAIALGHDVGHTPFGHVGERTLHILISGQNDNYKFPKLSEGFKHNFQSVHLLENLEKGSIENNGLNLTLAVLDGILKHTKSKIKINDEDQNVNYSSLSFDNKIILEKPAMTLEGQTVEIADEIAQVTHDLEDGIRSGIIKISDIKDLPLVSELLSNTNINIDKISEPVEARILIIKNLVGLLIKDVCKASSEKIKAEYAKKQYPKFQNMNDVFSERMIIFGKNIKEKEKQTAEEITKLVISSEEISIEDSKSKFIIERLFKAYYENPQQLPDYILKKYFSIKGINFNRLEIPSMKDTLKNDMKFIRFIIDHISGMTDQYAERQYIKFYFPEYK